MKKLFTLTLVLVSIFALSACKTDDSPPATLGNANAPILVEEFSDFECPACASISPQLEELISNNPEIARMEYRHFPLPYHKKAFPAAEASECANAQGKFWEFGRLAFANQKNLTEDNLKSFAKQLGLDMEAFESCFDGHEKKSKIMADIADGRLRQLPGTPSIYVNGTLVKWNGAEAFLAYLKSL